jgi:hypothetical protein
MQMTWSGESILNANRSTPIRAFSRNPQPNSGSYIPLPPFLCVSKVWVSISALMRGPAPSPYLRRAISRHRPHRAGASVAETRKLHYPGAGPDLAWRLDSSTILWCSYLRSSLQIEWHCCSARELGQKRAILAACDRKLIWA